MSSITTTNNNLNINDIATIMSALTISQKSTPDETIIVNKEFVQENDEYYLISRDGVEVEYSKSRGSFVISKKKVEVYPYYYFCNISQKCIKYPYKLEKGYALNKHVVLQNPHHQYYLKPVHYVSLNVSYFDSVRSIDRFLYVVFDIEDTRKTHAYALDKLSEHLPKEIIDNVALYLGIKKYKSKYELADFPFNFVQKYKETMPTYLSLAQIKKLYELGVVKIGFERHTSINIMTDAAFDYVYPQNGINRVRQLFGTKENMHTFIQSVFQ